ncbi:probable E3 ubiquitin-protein ligase RZFP34 [Glycine max]|uniref:probable E3 ubiquitin-protein ligase RZFP34 n=1 Tax=Glycine max TaxID=3847 RepID=UPI0003DEBFF6|nr:probable E3 ubiquitin-protein ligase RZFP34 [Glycine max]|eukprot:XP_006579057.1 probable E3 ubiquitin-protein ligase RZFP34 [Glycine max]
MFIGRLRLLLCSIFEAVIWQVVIIEGGDIHVVARHAANSVMVSSGVGYTVFHCHTCGCCYSTQLKNSHPCVEGAIHHDCPICFEYLFESVNDATVLLCGHTIHKSCLKEMREHFQYACPLCLKSVCDMSKVWEKFDLEIAATPIPEPYQNKMVSILCFSFLYDDVGYCRSSSC